MAWLQIIRGRGCRVALGAALKWDFKRNRQGLGSQPSIFFRWTSIFPGSKRSWSFSVKKSTAVANPELHGPANTAFAASSLPESRPWRPPLSVLNWSRMGPSPLLSAAKISMSEHFFCYLLSSNFGLWQPLRQIISLMRFVRCLSWWQLAWRWGKSLLHSFLPLWLAEILTGLLLFSIKFGLVALLSSSKRIESQCHLCFKACPCVLPAARSTWRMSRTPPSSRLRPPPSPPRRCTSGSSRRSTNNWSDQFSKIYLWE